MTTVVTQMREMTGEELDLVSGGKRYGGFVGGFWFAHDSELGVTTVGAGGTYVSTGPTPDGGSYTAVVKV